jgi:spermidine synthase/S-adenosylmethionine/arginine decarboxylase-like enzyme
MVMDLDDIVQIATCYRPHYHEYVTHFAARYKEHIRRAVFVGGGDSMLLHELLKFPDIELIVGLELDQVVVRRSFEHFHTQPHFDDERVQWWFGDATKSLLMLPKEYFGTFDLVLVDLSETVMALSVTDDLDILEALALLLKPDGIFVKNELYMNKLSEIFDYTIQMYFLNNPIICDQAVVIGSNSVDFLHPNADLLMKGHAVETLLVEPLKDFNDRFKHINAYRKNDARAHGKCLERNKTSHDSEGSAGILMIVEAENTTAPLEWKSLEGALSSALQNEGFTPLRTFWHPSESGGVIAVIVMGEGIVVARTWPEETYCAFDIQLWGAFNKMDDVRNALAKAVGSSSGSLSSYRIVTGGMRGTKTREEDQKTIGPRITQTRDCDEKTVGVGADVSIDESTVDVALEESLNLMHNKDIVVAVLCGNRKDTCKSLNVLAKDKNVREVVALYSCPGIDSAPYLDHGLTRMFECEVETLTILLDAVAKTDQLSVFVLDASANVDFAKVVERMFRNPRNQKRLLMPHSLFIAPMFDETETWRRNFLGRCRRYIEYHGQGILHRAEVTLKNTNRTLELGVISTGDPDFYLHLLDITNALERRTGLETAIPRIDAGPRRFQVNYNNDTFFPPDAYDAGPAKDQYSKQRPFGDQLILQLHIENNPTDLATKIQNAFSRSLKKADFSNSVSQEFDGLGDGVAFVAVSSEGSAIVVWDGGSRVDLNLYVHDSERTALFVKRFQKTLKKAQVTVKVLLRDEQPRGTGRVINFRRDIKATLNPPLMSNNGEE